MGGAGCTADWVEQNGADEWVVLSILYIGKLSSRKIFPQSPSTTKIKQMKYFLWQINGISLFRRVQHGHSNENKTDKKI